MFRRAFIIAVLISILLIHLPVVWFLATHKFSDTRLYFSQKLSKRQVVMIDLKEALLPKEIADINKPAIEEKPEHASVFTRYDSRVKQETVSRTTKSAPKTAATPAPAPIPGIPKEHLSLQERLSQIGREQKGFQREKFASLYETPTKPDAETVPSFSGTSDDFLPYYKIGDRTYLNALANPNIFYFVELKRKFRLAFSPEPVLRYNRDKISKREISVVWGVSVDKDGNLSDLMLIRGSGFDDYDNEARRTISSSAPFSKPPTHLLEKTGLLNMAWTFVVHL